MALAQFRKVYGKQGAGRFVVSEGVAPSAYLLPHDGLPTLYTDDEDDRFEVVITKGTILGLVTDDNGDSRVVPCGLTPGAGDSGVSDATNVAVPIGAAQYDLYRPFDKGTSQGAGWITHGYVEWPLIAGLNDTLTAGALVGSDGFGRPVGGATAANRMVGKVIEVERFATNFDDGLLSYMGLDEPALELVYSLQGTQPAGSEPTATYTADPDYRGRLGIRVNLDRVNAIGAVRVNLMI